MGGFARRKSGRTRASHYPHPLRSSSISRARLRVCLSTGSGCSSRPSQPQPRPPPSPFAKPIPPRSGKRWAKEACGCRAAQPWREGKTTRTWASANFPRDFLPHVLMLSVVMVVSSSLRPLPNPSLIARVVLWAKFPRPADRADDGDGNDGQRLHWQLCKLR
ncbi:hypothetical protein CGRA01v4_13490 [Colletotrichum graminicola]|nr:hypothetical protein CGRA01v4_13490 [Colletotrichum graminicola]